MRSLSILLAPLVLSLAALLGCSDDEIQSPADLEVTLLPTGSSAPDVTLIALDDSELELSSLRGQTLLLSFWYYDLKECREEIPKLQDLWSEVSTQRNDVAFLAVNLDDPTEGIEQWWKDNGFTLRAVRQDDEEVSEAFGVETYPTNYVIGPDGRVIYRGVGYEPDKIRLALESTATGR